MQRELKRLLHGDQAEQDMLGLVAAAGGGLSAGDLAELTGLPVYDIEENLRAVAGRTFTARASVWQPGTAPPVYVLGHEELQTAAAASLGPGTPGAEYRERLHAWAEGYRQRGWPAGTPEYLLRGYFRMLQDAADIPRLIACAADQARHDRMLDITGGDTAALTEITDVQDLLLRLDEPDLSALARLNVHRSIIAERNAHVPPILPAVWAMIGHPERAEALARAITDPDRQAQALAGLAEAAAGAGDLDRAEAWPGRSPTRTEQARALAAWRRRRRARVTWTGPRRLARAITDPDRQAEVLADLVEAAADAGDLDRAEAAGPGDHRPGPAGAGAGRSGAGGSGRGLTWTGPRRQPGRSPTRTSRHRRWPGWREAADRAGQVTWPTGPRRRPGRSPTRTGRRGRWPTWQQAAAGAGDLDRAEAAGPGDHRPGPAGAGAGRAGAGGGGRR